MNTINDTEAQYVVPQRFRKMENLHIVFWLFKDLAWCLGIKILGIAMIFPTILIAFLIAWQTRKIVSEFYHNLAVAVWIIANSFWMISEFFEYDSVVIFKGIICKHIALLPFSIGILILAYYYIILKKADTKSPNHKG